MGKIYKLNKTGTVGVSLTKSMKEAGFDVGKEMEWVALPGDVPFGIRLVKEEPKPTETAV
jgi:hypothetical protein